MGGPAAGDRRFDGAGGDRVTVGELAPAPGRWQRSVFIGLGTLTALVLSFSLQVPSFAASVNWVRLANRFQVCIRLPRLYGLALRSHAWHHLEHACFFARTRSSRRS